MKYLTFCFNKQIIAVDIMRVQEITGIEEIIHLNKHPKLTNHWINLLNRHLPVLDFRRHKIEISPETCVIVVRDEIHDLTFGLLADSLNEIMDISDDSNQQAIALDDLESVIKNTDVIKFMINMNDQNIWIMGPELLTNWQARKIYELYQ